MKYYAERGSPTLILRDTDSAKAYSEDSLKKLFQRYSGRTTNIIICTATFVVILSFAIIALILFSSFCTESYKKSKLLEKVKKNISAVFSLAILSLITIIYIICLAGSAVNFWQFHGEDELRRIFHNFDENRNLIPLIVALTIDLLCLIAWILIVFISTWRYTKHCTVQCTNDACPNRQLQRANYKREACHCITCTHDKPGPKCNHCQNCTKCHNDYIPILSLTVLCPIFCIIAHSPYIAIAYLDDGSHASSIFIYYSILGYVIFGLLWLFSHWCESFKISSAKFGIEIPVSDLHFITLVGLGSVIFLFLDLVVTISCYFVLIPINKSISDAPNRLYSIYGSGGFVIGSFIVYKILDFLRKKKADTITVEHIYEILQERLPQQQQVQNLLGLRQELHNIQQDVHQIRSTLSPVAIDGRGPPVPIIPNAALVAQGLQE